MYLPARILVLYITYLVAVVKSIYRGETVRKLKMRIKEHKDAEVAEHAWTNQHPVLWNETTVIDQVGRQSFS